jgi:hypothetical protein
LGKIRGLRKHKASETMRWPKPGPDSDRLRSQAEGIIEASGDGRAIRQLGVLRRDPLAWGATLLKLAAASPVMKVALGVFLGIIAADAVRGMLQGDVLQSLADRVDQAIEQTGGTETLERVAAGGTMSEAAVEEAMMEAPSIDDSLPEGEDSELGDLTDGLDLPF